MNSNRPAAPSNMRGSRLLTVCAVVDLALALLHVAAIFFGETGARFFTAPRFVFELIRTGSWLIVPVCLVIVAILGTFALYAWSAAGRMRRLPWLRGVLVTVGSIFTLRGLALLPQLILMQHHPGIFPWQAPVFSLVSLALGIGHLAGAWRRWKALVPVSNS